MKPQTNRSRVETPQRREQIVHHVGPAGLRKYARDIAEYEAPDTNGSTAGDGPWKAFFVAGDLLNVLAGHAGGGPLEVAILDDRQQPLVLSKCPGGVCHAGTKVPHSGFYTVRVRTMKAVRRAQQTCETAAGNHEGAVPFKLTRTRQLPRRLPRITPRRRRAHRRYVASSVRRVLAHLATQIGGLYERLPHRARRDTPATA
jgi:hypothetical protein